MADKRMSEHQDVTINSVECALRELFPLLDNVQRNVIDYTESRNNPETLESLQHTLWEVQGVLKMLELYGAAMLAEEMRQGCVALAHDALPSIDDTLDVMMRAALQLPDYLQRIAAGSPDVPLVLLPLLNDFRAALGEPLLTESILFLPDVDLWEGQQPPPDSGQVLVRVTKKLRLGYMKALVNWYAGRDTKESLSVLEEALAHLEQCAEFRGTEAFFRIVRGIIISLQDGGLSTSTAVKSLFGHVERLLRELADGGEPRLEATLSRELVRNLLFYIAKSTSTDSLLQELRFEYSLEALMPSEQHLRESRAHHLGPNLDMMQAAVSAVKQDLAEAQSLINEGGHPQESANVVPPLSQLVLQISNTLMMLGLGEAKALLEPALVVLQNVPSEGDPQAMMSIASMLINVERLLGQYEAEQAQLLVRDEGMEEAQQAVAHQQLTEVEQHSLLQAVIRESLRNLARIREGILEYIANPIAADQILQVPALLKEVHGALTSAQVASPLVLLEDLTGLVQARYCEQSIVPSDDEQIALADVISGLEYYLESVMQQGDGHQHVLENAITAMAHLVLSTDASDDEISLNAFDYDDDDDLDTTLAKELANETVIRLVDQGDESSVDAADVLDPTDVTAIPIIADVVDPSDTVVDASESQTEAEPEPAVTSPEPSAIADDDVPVAAPTVIEPPVTHYEDMEVLREGVSKEILGVFIEEALEAFTCINANFPHWKHDRQQTEALLNTRRAFHTLKGSGRLVGAMRLGEFAWSVENLLNKVIDGTRSADPDVVEFVSESLTVLPQLIAQLTGDTEEVDGVESLIVQGLTLATLPPAEPVTAITQIKVQGDGDEDIPVLQLDNSTTAVISEEESELDQTILLDDQSAPSSQQLDPVLLEIFSREAAIHLDLLETILRGKDVGAITPSNELLRALHTLHGSAQTAQVEVVARLSGPMERMARHVMTANRAFSAEETLLLIDGVEGIQLTLRALQQQRELNHYDTLVQSLTRCADSLEDEERDATAQDQALLQIFLVEAEELLTDANGQLLLWQNTLADDARSALLGALHTLKGGARVAGVDSLSDLAHALESHIQQTSPTEQTFDQIQETLDALSVALEQLARTGASGGFEWMIASLQEGVDASIDMPQETPPPPAPPAPIDTLPEKTPVIIINTDSAEQHSSYLLTQSVAELLDVPPDPPVSRPALDSGSELIRVPATHLDHLADYAGEISIFQSRLNNQQTQLRRHLSELGGTLPRLREKLRMLVEQSEKQLLDQRVLDSTRNVRGEGYDTLEMERYSALQETTLALEESVSDIASVHRLLQEQLQEGEAQLSQQGQITVDLQESLKKTRMVRFEQLGSRMARVVRQTASALEKDAQIVVIGGERQIDRAIHERMAAPLEHLIRNAVAHGIEPMAQRETQGKATQGKVILRLMQEGGDILISVVDDGAGIDFDKVRSVAIETQRLSADASYDEEQLIAFLCESGFTTEGKPGQHKGRGIGLDVVSREVAKLGGLLRIVNEPGQGCGFIIRLPQMLHVARTLVVRLGQQPYCIPVTGIRAITHVPVNEMTEDGHFVETYQYANETYHVAALAGMLGLESSVDIAALSSVPLVLMHAGNRLVALVVDEFIGREEVSVKSVPLQLSHAPGLSGVSLMQDGAVAYVLDIGGLLLTADTQQRPVIETNQLTESSAKRVMVVDDSITIRKVMERMLERHGLDVQLAKDGVDAIAKLQEWVPDIILIDIEMPRMNGFELATFIRNTPSLRHIPIIVITSRTGAHHRQKAVEIGVDRYLGKPYQETELLATVDLLLKRQSDN